MNATINAEKLVSLALQLAEGQIATLNFLGYNRYRGQLINDLKQKVLSLLNFVKEAELSAIQDLMRSSDEIVETAAKCGEMFIVDLESGEGRELVPIDNKSLIKKLTQVEDATIEIITKYFEPMKKEIQNLLSTIDKLPR